VDAVGQKQDRRPERAALGLFLEVDRMSHSYVFVIGAGPAGLTSAYLLTKQGISTTVIEADPTHVGGISRTASYKNFLFDIGGHRFFSKSKEVVDLWNEILPDDFISRPRMSRIYYNGNYFSYPLKAFEALTNLGPVESGMCVLSFMYKQAFPNERPVTFHEWVANQFGERLFSIFFKTYTEKVWGMSCDEISADWAAQRIKGLDLWSAMSNALRNQLMPAKKGPATNANGEIIKTLIDSFQYPRRGPGMMWDAAARKVRERDGEIHMGTTLESLRWDKVRARWSITAKTVQGEPKSFTARHVISSAPIRELLAGMSPAPDCKAAADKLRYRDFITVALIVEKPDLFPDNWIYIHEPAVKVGRIQNFRSWSPEMVPNPNQSCLGLEYFCFEGDGLWNATDGELIGLAKKELEQIGLAAWNDVKDGCVVRQKKAYPVYDDGYKANVEEIRGELGRKYPTLHLVGRNGMHKYNNQDHAMMTAMLTVKNIVAGSNIYDVWNVNEDAEYHEAGEAGAREALGSVRLVPQRVDAA
jgi:protoporphyrinogen oxidase